MATEFNPNPESLLDDVHKEDEKEGLASRFQRFLWFAAGADPTILKRCPHSDKVKHEGVGGIVLATGILAFGSGSYAFYTVLSEKDPNLATFLGNFAVGVVSLLLGLVWACIIFNLDRFIVSSTGHGDGTEDITWNEMVKGLPRIVMAAIIGMCISAPLEIRILKTEIESELVSTQAAQAAKTIAEKTATLNQVKADREAKAAAGQKRIDDSAAYFEKRRQEITAQMQRSQDEANGLVPGHARGHGPIFAETQLNQEKLERDRVQDLEEAKVKLQPVQAEVNALRSEIAGLDASIAKVTDECNALARKKDGLMERIKISHRIGGFIPWAIMLLLLCIETGPIFFKMMLIKGVYEYAEENARRLRCAREGIHPNGSQVKDKSGHLVYEDIYHHFQHEIELEKDRLRHAAELSQLFNQRFHAAKSAEIQGRPLDLPPEVEKV